jgi:hypothetical protein
VQAGGAVRTSSISQETPDISDPCVFPRVETMTLARAGLTLARRAPVQIRTRVLSQSNDQ